MSNISVKSCLSNTVSDMRSIAVIFSVFLILLLGVPAHCADTNVLIIPAGDTRPGAVFFVDECLTRGLTNSISIRDLRTWATNVIQRYNQRQPPVTGTNADENLYLLSPTDVPEAIRSIQDRTPSCRSAQPMPKIEGWDKYMEIWSKSAGISKKEAEERWLTLDPDPDPPKVDFWRSDQGTIEAIGISWYEYGVIVGPESFKPKWEHDPWYYRKLEDGIYLYHGYK
jgi:hypothetical protein